MNKQNEEDEGSEQWKSSLLFPKFITIKELCLGVICPGHYLHYISQKLEYEQDCDNPCCVTLCGFCYCALLPLMSDVTRTVAIEELRIREHSLVTCVIGIFLPCCSNFQIGSELNSVSSIQLSNPPKQSM